MKSLKILLKNKIEVLLMVILIVSSIVFILNTKESVSEEVTNEPDIHERATIFQEDDDNFEEDLYTKSMYISDEVFIKYFTGQIGEEICFSDDIYHKYQSWSPDKDDKGEIIYTKTRMVVNGVSFVDECEGETLEEGWTFCLIDITVFNDYPEERLLSHKGSIAEWDFENNSFISGNDVYKLLADEGVVTYKTTKVGDDSLYMPFDEGFVFSVKPGENITYKAVFKVPVDYINNKNIIFYEQCSGKTPTNHDFGIRLFPEE
ncbi:MAG: hypothetical protein ACI4E1_10785 [Lachnospira sp.]